MRRAARSTWDPLESWKQGPISSHKSECRRVLALYLISTSSPHTVNIALFLSSLPLRPSAFRSISYTVRLLLIVVREFISQ